MARTAGGRRGAGRRLCPKARGFKGAAPLRLGPLLAAARRAAEASIRCPRAAARTAPRGARFARCTRRIRRCTARDAQSSGGPAGLVCAVGAASPKERKSPTAAVDGALQRHLSRRCRTVATSLRMGHGCGRAPALSPLSPAAAAGLRGRTGGLAALGPRAVAAHVARGGRRLAADHTVTPAVRHARKTFLRSLSDTMLRLCPNSRFHHRAHHLCAQSRTNA